MPTPDFILSLRAKIGHDQLWLPGVSVVVTDPEGRVLLGRRSDSGRWAVVSGVPEPGEQPAAAALRECEEETGVTPEILGVTAVEAEEPIEFPNGDRCVFMSIDFVARTDAAGAARARVGDEESTAVGWFSPDALPEPVPRSTRRRIEAARAWLDQPGSGARFRL
ncbi:NUDIX hydrolase [Actinomyces faecalis]|uniref:NUDIX hydrolase n=1 Tax=Actinomyces faecalis TaxID=2722820 RepID=UPI0015550995|nr:NUDIX domain-containing protein [Actinomyces faecalis]